MKKSTKVDDILARKSALKPGTKRAPRLPYRILCLTFDMNVNEFITRQQGNLLGTETEKTGREVPPGYTTEQDLHVLNEVIFENLKNWQDARGKYEIFVRKTEGGRLYRYGTATLKEKAKTDAAKSTLTTAS